MPEAPTVAVDGTEGINRGDKMTDPAILRTHYPLILSLRIRRTDVGLESRQKLVVRNNRDVLRFYKKVRPVLANGIMDGSLPSVLLDDLQAEARHRQERTATT